MIDRSELIGVVVSTTEGMRIQLLDDVDSNRFVVRYQDAHQVASDEKFLSYKEPGTKDGALVAALDEFVKRIRAEREGLKTYVPIEEFALVLNSSGDPQEIGDYNVYTGNAATPEESISQAEDAAIAAGLYDIEELRNNSDYSASIGALLRSAEGSGHTGIALLIR